MGPLHPLTKQLYENYIKPHEDKIKKLNEIRDKNYEIEDKYNAIISGDIPEWLKTPSRTENQIKHDILNIHQENIYHLQSQIRLHKTDTDYDTEIIDKNSELIRILNQKITELSLDITDEAIKTEIQGIYSKAQGTYTNIESKENDAHSKVQDIGRTIQTQLSKFRSLKGQNGFSKFKDHKTLQYITEIRKLYSINKFSKNNG